MRSRQPSARTPLAVCDKNARQPCILDCNPAAKRAGIRPGMPVNAAFGLLDTLRVGPDDPQARMRALEHCAAVAYRYSSEVSIASQRDALLLEVGASRKLFGKPPALAAMLVRRLRPLGHQVMAGSAPTPRAALLLALREQHVADTTRIGTHIAQWPVTALELDQNPLSTLHDAGFRSVADVLRLPRRSLARRIGPDAADYLDRLLGNRPDPQKSWHPAEAFEDAVDLPAEAQQVSALRFPLKCLVGRLCTVLRARDRGVQSLTLDLALDTGRSPPDRQQVQLNLRQPSRDADYLLARFRDRFERLKLPRPVRRLSLTAPRLLPFRPQQESLFCDTRGQPEQALTPLLERLQARLGRDAVRGLRGVPDHRPEYSWAVRDLDEPADCVSLPHRPSWLFSQPQRCRIEDYELLAGPERIESGWWDSRDCRRDYVVRSRQGSLLWAFREYKPRSGWFLHGLFS